MGQTIYLQSANSSSHSQSMSPYWSTVQITMSILLNKLKCECNKINEIKSNSKSIINKLINIKNVRVASGWFVYIAFLSVSSLKMMFSCLYKLDAYNLRAYFFLIVKLFIVILNWCRVTLVGAIQRDINIFYFKKTRRLYHHS